MKYKIDSIASPSGRRAHLFTMDNSDLIDDNCGFLDTNYCSLPETGTLERRTQPDRPLQLTESIKHTRKGTFNGRIHLL